MARYTIAGANLTSAEMTDLFDKTKKLYDNIDFTDLNFIFSAALTDYSLFPAIHLSGNASSKTYMEKWVGKYCAALKALPSERNAKPKSSCNDPAIKAIIAASQGIDGDEADRDIRIHNLCMSAENIAGDLLEEYIAQNIRQYGFIWCIGETLRAVDFCSIDGMILLQIKNKFNTENSSSSAVREGKNIKKWFRLGMKKRNGIVYPDYKWAALNDLINEHKTQNLESEMCSMSETEYQEFLRKAVLQNPNLITDK